MLLKHWLDIWCYSEADGPTNREQTPPNNVKCYTAASSISAGPTLAL